MTDLAPLPAAPHLARPDAGEGAHAGPSRRHRGSHRSGADRSAAQAAVEGDDIRRMTQENDTRAGRRGGSRPGRRGGKPPNKGSDHQTDVDRLLSNLHIQPVEPKPAPSAQPHSVGNAARSTQNGALDPAAPSFEPGGASGQSGPGSQNQTEDSDRSSVGKPRRHKGRVQGANRLPSTQVQATQHDQSGPTKAARRVRAEGEVEPATGRSGRRAAFEQQSRLTDGRQPIHPPAHSHSHETGSATSADVSGRNEGKQAMRRERKREEEKDDLLSKLMRGLRQRPFLECPICFNPITPSQPIWSCVPHSVPPNAHATSSGLDPITSQPSPAAHQACYTPFHLKCIRSWATQSLEADAARLASFGLDKEDGDEPSWRCPGCQKRREDAVGEYTCFCGRVANPEPGKEGKGGMPHSCGEGCGRKRVCGHACSLGCHPGPCPPCQVSLIVTCPSHHTPLTVKCALAHTPAHPGALSPICDEPCLRLLNCGTHTCERLCHFGDCGPCEEKEAVRCFCGKEEKQVECGWKKGDAVMCTNGEDGAEHEGSQRWEGRWGCGKACDRKYDCLIHTCDEPCHPHSLSTLSCPFSPAVVITCPCGQTALADLPDEPRTACTDPIPTCSLPCPRSRACGHPCPWTCHTGPCPTCTADVVRPCRCGESRMRVPCSQLEALESGRLPDGSLDLDAEGLEQGSGIRCDRVCRSLRNCGKHECGRVCCPLAHLAGTKGKKGTKKGDLLVHALLPRRGERAEGEEMHDCPLTCGKMLGCGIHTCERKDHRGKCGRCLQASYDELVCHCGRTVVYPPVPCGTTLSCPYPCTRPPAPCGHPRSSHPCHQDTACPPCPYLTTRPCACGKDLAVKNVRCSTSPDKVSCGQACGRLLPCGYHRCDRPCHLPPEEGGECGDLGKCTQTCSKPKKTCGHPCTHACHAPARCPETEPCQTIILQTCACGHLQQRASCGASSANPVSRERQGLKCNSECLVRQRNARLAEALGIDEGRESRAGKTDWSVEMIRFARVNIAWIKVVEKTLGDFIGSGKAMQILPSMPQAKRAFVLQLVEPYRLSASLVDQPPNESVQIRRRADSKIPIPLLSAAVSGGTPAATKTSWGGLSNLRALAPASAGSAPVPGGPPKQPVTLGTAAWAKTSGTSSSSNNNGSWSLTTGATSIASQETSREPSRAATPVAPSVLSQTGGQRAGGISGGAGHVPVAPAGGGGLQVGKVGEVEDVDWDED